MQSVVAETAAVLLVGNELLSGKVTEANLFELARTLRALGIRLERALVLPDELPILTREVRALSQSHDVVFTSGGVGPTHDDVTIEAVANAARTIGHHHQGGLAGAERQGGRRVVHRQDGKHGAQSERLDQPGRLRAGADDRDRHPLGSLVAERDAESGGEKHGEDEHPEHRLGLAEELPVAHQGELHQGMGAPAPRLSRHATADR